VDSKADVVRDVVGDVTGRDVYTVVVTAVESNSAQNH